MAAVGSEYLDEFERLVRRRHADARARSEAVFSACGLYRYALTRVWGDGPRLHYVMLNPSKADEVANDPTVERCERRARALGYGAFRVTNIFGFRATDPRVLRAATTPVGPDNDAAVLGGAAWADATLCAWGAHGVHLGRGAEVGAMLRKSGARLLTLGLTKEGHPRHPLYVTYAKAPEDWA